MMMEMMEMMMEMEMMMVMRSKDKDDPPIFFIPEHKRSKDA